MLPPGFLERLELSPRLAPDGRGADATCRPTTRDPARPALAARRRAVRDLAGAGGPRRAHPPPPGARDATGRVTLDWTLTAAAGRPALRALGAPRRTTDGGRPTARARSRVAHWGRASRTLLRELAADRRRRARRGRARGSRTASSALPGPRPPGPRRRRDPPARAAGPRASARAGSRGARPAGIGAAARAGRRPSTRSGDAIAARDATPLLLDGVTGAGKTAVYVEAIAASLEAGRPALVLVPGDRARAAARRSPAGRPRRRRCRSCTFGPERGRARRRMASDPRRVRSTSSPARGWPSWRRSADVGVIIVDEEHEGAYKSDRTPRLQARDTAIELGAARRRRRSSSAARRRRSRASGRARDGRYRRVALPARPTGRRADDRARRPARRARGRQPRTCCRRRCSRHCTASTARAAIGRSCVINRRGSASIVLCRDCGHVQACPGMRPAARLPPGRDDAALPSLRDGRTRRPRAARTAPRRASASWAAARSASSARFASGCPGLRVGRLDRDVVGASRRRRAGARRIPRRPARRPRGHEPGRQGPRRARGDAWSASCPPTWRSTCPTSAPRSGRTSC